MPEFTKQAVVREDTQDFEASALVGIYSIILGWNVKAHVDREKLLGFAIRRTTFDHHYEILEMRWLKGQKRFKAYEEERDPGFEIPSYAAPFQRFRWSDYSTTPNTNYRYEIFPVVGSPLELTMLSPVVLDVCTFDYEMTPFRIHFNRGVTSALAYYERFKDKAPSEIPDGSAYRWLSRGLKESLLSFLKQAASGDEIHISIYEFHDIEIAQILKNLIEIGVKVEIVYHAADQEQPTTRKNFKHLSENGLLQVSTPRTNIKLSHNKFAVLLRGGSPTFVWTGSANFTEAGFYFQTNFGVEILDHEIAFAFEKYFQLLKQDLPRGRKRQGAEFIQEKIHNVMTISNGIFSDDHSIMFSPIRSNDVLDTAVDLIRSAREAVFLSTPFAMDQSLVEAIGSNSHGILEYGLANTTVRKKIEDFNKRNTRFFTPTRLETYLGRRWDAKMFGNHKIHAKMIVVDPYSEKSAVLFGSANFSKASCRYNDENMLLIKGNNAVSAILATEFIRMFDHYKSRWFINKFFTNENQQIRYLEDNGSWSDIYFNPTSRSHKFRDREVFSGKVNI